MKTTLIFPVHTDNLNVNGLLSALAAHDIDVVYTGINNPAALILWPLIIKGRIEVIAGRDRQILTEFKLPFNSLRDLNNRLIPEVEFIQSYTHFQD